MFIKKKKSSRTFHSLEVREEMRTQQRRLKKEQPHEAGKIWENLEPWKPLKEAFRRGGMINRPPG